MHVTKKMKERAGPSVRTFYASEDTESKIHYFTNRQVSEGGFSR